MFSIIDDSNRNNNGGSVIMWTKIRVLVLSILCVCMCGCKGVPTNRYAKEDAPKYKEINYYYNVIYYLDYQTLRYEITWADPKSSVVKNWLVYVTFIVDKNFENTNMLIECDLKDYFIVTKY